MFQSSLKNLPQRPSSDSSESVSSSRLVSLYVKGHVPVKKRDRLQQRVKTRVSDSVHLQLPKLLESSQPLLPPAPFDHSLPSATPSLSRPAPFSESPQFSIGQAKRWLPSLHARSLLNLKSKLREYDDGRGMVALFRERKIKNAKDLNQYLQARQVRILKQLLQDQKRTRASTKLV